MTDPFFLEVIVNSDLLPSERPFVLAHEWAHIAGYADESEANFISWLTCVRASPAAQYSGWLAAYQHISSGLPPADRRMLAATLSPPVRMDLAAERERFGRSSPSRSRRGPGRLRHLPASEPDRGGHRQLQRGSPPDARRVTGRPGESAAAMRRRAAVRGSGFAGSQNGRAKHWVEDREELVAKPSTNWLERLVRTANPRTANARRTGIRFAVG